MSERWHRESDLDAENFLACNKLVEAAAFVGSKVCAVHAPSSNALVIKIDKFVYEARKIPGCSGFLNVDGVQTLVGVVNIAALAATSMNCSDTLLNILSYHNSAKLVEKLREEARQLYTGEVTVAKLDAMTLTDSVCRESLRLENGDDFFVQGAVTTPVQTPEGLLLPKGTRVALPIRGIHRDERLFPGDPASFNPYRFLATGTKQMMAYEASEQYLPFSIGPHVSNMRRRGRWRIGTNICQSPAPADGLQWLRSR